MDKMSHLPFTAVGTAVPSAVRTAGVYGLFLFLFLF